MMKKMLPSHMPFFLLMSTTKYESVTYIIVDLFKVLVFILPFTLILMFIPSLVLGDTHSNECLWPCVYPCITLASVGSCVFLFT